MVFCSEVELNIQEDDLDHLSFSFRKGVQGQHTENYAKIMTPRTRQVFAAEFCSKPFASDFCSKPSALEFSHDHIKSILLYSSAFM